MTEIPDLQLNKHQAATALTPPSRQLHRRILTAFADTGHAPSRNVIEQMALDHGVDPGPALSELTDADVLAVDDHGEIRAAYPFSPTPTRHRVTWDGSAGVYAMCAIDALGMSTMLGHPVIITSTEPGTDRPVTVHVDHGAALWIPDSTVVFAGASGDACCPSINRTCHHINFFTSHAASRDWVARNPTVTGIVLDQTQALASGVAEFGALLKL